jgi:uncharacterized membrane protein YqiK
VSAKSDAERREIAAAAQAASLRQLGEAEAAKEAALMEVYANVGRDVLTALALRDAAPHLPNVGSLTVTPDLVSGLLSALTARAGGPTADAGPAAER